MQSMAPGAEIHPGNHARKSRFAPPIAGSRVGASSATDVTIPLYGRCPMAVRTTRLRPPPAAEGRLALFPLACLVVLSPLWPGRAVVWAQEPSLFSRECPTADSSRMVVSIEGVVRDRDSEVPLPNASVRFVYEEAEDAPLGETAVEVQSDARGRYRLCGLAAFARGRVTPAYGGVEGRSEEATLDRNRRLDLRVELGDAAYLVVSAVAVETGEPVASALVELDPLPLIALTDSMGRAPLRRIPPGEYRLRIHHIGYAGREEPVTVKEGQLAELRVELRTEPVALEPLTVEITGRDPYLLETGFYDRRNQIDDGWFATKADVEGYVMLKNLFEFKRELVVRYARNRFVLIDGRPAKRLGFDSVGELNEIPFQRVRGIEAYPCHEAPAAIWHNIPVTDQPLGDCNVVLIWTR